jgi:SAM-dependent methyltransferase
MKRFSELTSSVESQSSNLTETIVDDVIENIQEDIIETESPYPNYMIEDSNFVGYESDYQQYVLYRAAEFGTIVTGIETVLDVGCGRGDFGSYLLNRYPNVKYTGLDLNELMIQIGQHKYSQTFSTFRYNLQEAIFNNQLSTGQKYDYVYHINTMSLDYGLWPEIYSDDRRYDYIKMMITKSLDLCNIGTVFILHNDSIESSGELSYSLTPLSKILYDMNVKFAIDNTDVPDMYKLVILKNSF